MRLRGFITAIPQLLCAIVLLAQQQTSSTINGVPNQSVSISGTLLPVTVSALSSIPRAMFDPMDPKYCTSTGTSACGLQAALAVTGSNPSAPTQVIQAAMDAGQCAISTGATSFKGIRIPLPASVVIPIGGLKLWGNTDFGGDGTATAPELQHNDNTVYMVTQHTSGDTLTCNGTSYTPTGVGGNDYIHDFAIAGMFAPATTTDAGIVIGGSSNLVRDILGAGNIFGGPAVFLSGTSVFGDHLGYPSGNLQGCKTYNGGVLPVSSFGPGHCESVMSDSLDGGVDHVYATDGQTIANSNHAVGSCYPLCAAIGAGGSESYATDLFAQISSVGILVNGASVRGNNWRIDDSAREAIRIASTGAPAGGALITEVFIDTTCADQALQANYTAGTATGCAPINDRAQGSTISQFDVINSSGIFSQAYNQCWVWDNVTGGSGASNIYSNQQGSNFSPQNTTANDWAYCGVFDGTQVAGRVVFSTQTPMQATTATPNVNGIPSIYLNGQTVTNMTGGIGGQIETVTGPGVIKHNAGGIGNIYTPNGLDLPIGAAESVQFINTETLANPFWIPASGMGTTNGVFYVNALSPTCTVSGTSYSTGLDCAFANAKLWVANHANQNATLVLGSNGILTTALGLQMPSAAGNHGTINIIGQGVNASYVQLTGSLGSTCMVTQPDEVTANNSAYQAIQNVTLDLNNNSQCALNIDGVKSSAYEHIRVQNVATSALGTPATPGGYAVKFGGTVIPNSKVFDTVLNDIGIDTGGAGGFTPAGFTCTNLTTPGNPSCSVSNGGSYPLNTGNVVQVWGSGNGSGACSVYPTWTLTYSGSAGAYAVATITASGGTCTGVIYPALQPPPVADYAFYFPSGFTDNRLYNLRAIMPVNYATLQTKGHPNHFYSYHPYAGQPVGIEDYGGNTYTNTECDSLGGFCSAIEGLGSQYFGTSSIYNGFTGNQGGALFYLDQSVTTVPTLYSDGVTCNGNRQTRGGYTKLMIGTGLPYNNTSTAGGTIESGYAIPDASIQMDNTLDCGTSPTTNTFYSHIGSQSIAGGTTWSATGTANASSGNFGSYPLQWLMSYWNGTAATPANWQIAAAIGTGTSPNAVLQYTCTAPGTCNVSVPGLTVVAGIPGINNNGTQWQAGTSLPGTCNAGDFYNLQNGTSAAAVLQVCYPANTWNPVGTGAGMSGVPTCAADAGAGSGASCSIISTNGTSTDGDGWVSLTTGTTPLGSNTGVVNVNYGGTYSSTPKCGYEPANPASATLSGATEVYISSGSSNTSAHFVIFGGSTALPAGTYIWHWHCTTQ